jgi:membrane protease YdiL (CAAX protease family)
MKEPWINSGSRLTAMLGRGPQKGDKLDVTMFVLCVALWLPFLLIGATFERYLSTSVQYYLDWVLFCAPALPGFYILQREYRPRLAQFGMTLRQLGSGRTWLWSLTTLLMVVALRLPMAVALRRIAASSPGSSPQSFGWAVNCSHWRGFVLFGVAIAPAVEEFVFRGYFYLLLRQNSGGKKAALLSSAAFGLLHGVHAAPFEFMFSLVVIYFNNRASSLCPSLVGHAAWNGTLLFFCKAVKGLLGR